MPTVINKGRTGNKMQSIGEISPTPNLEQVLNVSDRPLKEVSGGYTFVEEDRGKYLLVSYGDVTLDDGVFPIGSELIFRNCTGIASVGADIDLISTGSTQIYTTTSGGISPITIPNGYVVHLKQYDTDLWLFSIYGYEIGASGSFTTVDLKTVTVVNGLITSIV